MILETIKKYALKYWYVIVYFVLTNIYLVSLRSFNKVLNEQHFKSQFDLIKYHHYMSLDYLFWAVVFGAVGCIICRYCFLQIKNIMSRNLSDDIQYLFVSMITAILILQIFIAIWVPILKAIFTVVIIGFSIYFAFRQKKLK